jgi:hypothetical protein
MRINQPFLKLPKAFSAETLAAEVRALPPSAWVPHPGNYPGNDAVLLVTPHGGMTNGFEGPMAPTEYLRRSPYIMEVMADIGAVWGRSRLMGLGAGAQVPAHVDVNYHWRTHLRIHIPIITNPKVVFTCDGDAVHMAPGECWVFDSFRMHNVQNGGTEKRVHLVLDTVGGEEMWDLIDRAQAGSDGPVTPLPAGRTRTDALLFERVESARIMSPWEVRCHLDYIADHLLPDTRADKALARLNRFASAWTALWARFSDRPDGLPHYHALIAATQRELLAGGGDLKLSNHVPLSRALTELIFQPGAPARVSASLQGADTRLAS